MAAPTFVAASTGGNDVGGAWSYTATGAGAVGRLMILHVLQCGTSASNAISISSITNMNNLAGSSGMTALNGGVGLPVGSTSSPTGYHYIFIGRSTSTSAAVVTGANSGTDDIYFRMYEFQNANAGSTLADVIENITAGGFVYDAAAVAAVTDSGVVTMGPNRLAANFIGCSNDNAIGPMTGMSGGTWGEAVAEFSTSTGTDGMLSLQTAAMSSQGTINGGSVTMTGATPWDWGNIGFAIVGSGEARVYNKSSHAAGQEFASGLKNISLGKRGGGTSDHSATGAGQYVQYVPPVTGPSGFDHFLAGEAVPVLPGKLGAGSDPWGLDGTLAGEFAPALAHTPTGTYTYLPTGQAALRATGSGADVVIFTEAGRAVSRETGRGSKLTVYQESGRAASRVTGRGADQDVYARTGSATANLSASGSKLITIDAYTVRVTQEAVEVLINLSVPALISQVAVETLLSNVPTPRVSFDRVKFNR